MASISTTTGGMKFDFNGIKNYVSLFKDEVTTDSQPMARLFAETVYTDTNKIILIIDGIVTFQNVSYFVAPSI